MNEGYCKICGEWKNLDNAICNDCINRIDNQAKAMAITDFGKILYDTIENEFQRITGNNYTKWEDITPEDKNINTNIAAKVVAEVIKQADVPLTTDFVHLIKAYYEARKYQWPTTYESMAWAHREMGEAYEVLLAKRPNWVRNNPANHPTEFSKDRFAEELGDAIMMLIVAGIVEKVDAINAMLSKIYTKLSDLGEKYGKR